MEDQEEEEEGEEEEQEEEKERQEEEEERPMYRGIKHGSKPGNSLLGLQFPTHLGPLR
jgi:hypothetical protein